MVDFKKAPDPAGASAGDLIQVHASQVAVDGTHSGLFTLEQWFIIAMTGMALSLLMIIAGLVVSWRRKRRRQRLEQ